MRLIDADALKEQCFEFADDVPRSAMAFAQGQINCAPTIEAEPVRHGRCRYCSPNDCGGLQWDFEDIEVSVTLQCGVLTICNQYGEEAEMPINYCPNCGAKMDLKGEQKCLDLSAKRNF